MLDYKNVIKSRKVRLRILRLLSWIPDKTMLKIQYRIKTGHRLNLKNPKRYTEKLQWYKLYYRDPLMIQCVDKYDVREYVKSKGLENILIHCYGVFGDAESIAWESLPNSFVMKDTLGGGGTGVVVVKDKDTADIRELKKKAAHWVALKSHIPGSGREWPYYCGKNHRIIIEQFLDADFVKGGLVDYKFFCFNGKVQFIYAMGDRRVGNSVKVSIFDRDFNKLPVLREGDDEFLDAIKPEQYDEMVSIADKLGEDFPHVRVDLYNVDGHIYFGELTFFNASGYMKYNPDSFDVYVGGLWKL